MAACHYWRTHGASPGTPIHAEDLLAWEVYWQAQQVGWEAVWQLRRLDTFDDYAADWLLIRLIMLAEYVRQQQTIQQEMR